MPSVSTTATSRAPARPQTCRPARRTRVGTRRVDAEERRMDAVLGGKAHRGRDAAEHLLAVDADGGQLQIRDRRLDHRRRHTELDERLQIRGNRPGETPHLGLSAPHRRSADRVPVVMRDPRESRLDPVDAELVEQLRDSSFCSGSSTTPTVCSPSRSVVSYSPTVPPSRYQSLTARPDQDSAHQHSERSHPGTPTASRRPRCRSGSCPRHATRHLPANRRPARSPAPCPPRPCRRPTRVVPMAARARGRRCRGRSGASAARDSPSPSGRRAQHVELGKVRSGLAMRDRLLVDADQLLLELAVVVA